MTRRDVLIPTLLALMLSLPADASAGITEINRCQRKIATEGAKFALRIIRSTLRCTNAVTECQVQCELGVFGPPCDPVPEPGCCDPDDPNSNITFKACMDDADATCDKETAKQATWETNKRNNITSVCLNVSQEELCGAQTPGLNFETLNAGCLALDPGYTCNVTNLVACVGGPLEKALLDQVSATLSPRASDAVAALGLHAQFPDIPIARKVTGQVAAGRVDVWAITGQAGDEIVVKVKTRDDNGNDTSSLNPLLVLLGSDLGMPTPVPDSQIRNITCPVPNVCGSPCPLLRRRLPFSGTFHLAVGGLPGGGCGGGGYRMVLISPAGTLPALVADDALLAIPST